MKSKQYQIRLTEADRAYLNNLKKIFGENYAQIIRRAIIELHSKIFKLC